MDSDRMLQITNILREIGTDARQGGLPEIQNQLSLIVDELNQESTRLFRIECGIVIEEEHGNVFLDSERCKLMLDQIDSILENAPMTPDGESNPVLRVAKRLTDIRNNFVLKTNQFIEACRGLPLEETSA